MILISHIIIALTSVAYATWVFFRPSLTGLRASYGLIAATVVSGTFLVISTHAAMLQSCTTGLVYIAGVSFIVARAHARYAMQQEKIQRTNRTLGQ